MDKTMKLIILLVGLGILLNLLKNTFFKTKKQEIIVAGHHVDKGPCMYAMNELYGRGIDSSKLCDCLIPRFYELIKNDPSKTKKFEEMGLFQLDGPLNNGVIVFFGECASKNIADSSFKLNLEKFKEPFLKKLKDSLSTYKQFRNYDFDSLAKCYFENLNGKVTIAEYFSEDYMKVDVIRNTIINCVTQNQRE
jgi:hypothetical protein